MQYLVSFLGGAAICGGLIVNKLYNKKSSLVLKIVAILGIAILAVRMFSYQSEIWANSGKYWGVESSPLHNGGLTAFSLLMIWGGYSCILFCLSAPFFNVKYARNITKYICPIFFLIQPFFLGFESTILEVANKPSLLLVFYSIETAFGLGISAYYLIESIMNKEKVKIADLGIMLGLFLILSIFTMPTYMPQYLIGFVKTTKHWIVLDMKVHHRILFYFSIITPMVIHFSLMGRDYELKRFTLLYMCLGVMMGFILRYNYSSFAEPWTWPFHLCNTALFVLPLVLAFKMKRLFYFTYFINVFGALLAMLMPNYAEDLNIMSNTIVNFWYNHYFAFFTPILCVSLSIFERPKIKQFIYSIAWFLVYYIMVLILDVTFTEMLNHMVAAGKLPPTYNTNVDFFFINSDFVADKLGGWAEQLFNFKFTIKIGTYNLEFAPVYQATYFLVYVLLSLAIWFVYGESYRIADSNAMVWLRLKAKRREDMALKKALAGRKKEEPMEKDAGIKYELKHFSKRYGTSKKFAVNDANFEVKGGEIFGFLGPNGAGKSTIIKSTVGIQPITSGNINICGYDVATQPVQCKALVGFVPDHYALYEKLTGREYVNYIADIYGVSEEDRNERIERYIQRFELEHSIDNMIKTYSHGMKQKITIMAALVHDPKVWILDEPLTGLDPNSIYQVKECMKEHAARGNIVFFSSHIIDIVEKLCVRIAIIKHGEIQCIKTVEEIEQGGDTLEQFYLKTIGDNELNPDQLEIEKQEAAEQAAKEEKKKKHHWFKRKEK